LPYTKLTRCSSSCSSVSVTVLARSSNCWSSGRSGARIRADFRSAMSLPLASRRTTIRVETLPTRPLPSYTRLMAIKRSMRCKFVATKPSIAALDGVPDVLLARDQTPERARWRCSRSAEPSNIPARLRRPRIQMFALESRPVRALRPVPTWREGVLLPHKSFRIGLGEPLEPGGELMLTLSTAERVDVGP
jgi:hypothetical protein